MTTTENGTKPKYKLEIVNPDADDLTTCLGIEESRGIEIVQKARNTAVAALFMMGEGAPQNLNEVMVQVLEKVQPQTDAEMAYAFFSVGKWMTEFQKMSQQSKQHRDPIAHFLGL